MGAWNTGSLFGGIASTGRAQTHKRRCVSEVLTSTHILALSETRGVESDLMPLPPTHAYFGSLTRTTGPATSSSGGVVFAAHKSDHPGRLGRSSAHTHTHMRGRAIAVSVNLQGWVHLRNVHMDPAHPFAQKRRLLLELTQFLERQTGNSYMMGGWNSMLSGESRMSGLGIDIGPSDNMTYFSTDAFNIRLHQISATTPFVDLPEKCVDTSCSLDLFGYLQVCTQRRSRR